MRVSDLRMQPHYSRDDRISISAARKHYEIQGPPIRCVEFIQNRGGLVSQEVLRKQQATPSGTFPDPVYLSEILWMSFKGHHEAVQQNATQTNGKWVIASAILLENTVITCFIGKNFVTNSAHESSLIGSFT